MSSKKTKIIKFLSKVIIITLLIVLLVRGLMINTFLISTKQMESTLVEGDNVLVNKMAYGSRLPITAISLQLPYTRLFARSIRQNDVIVFNSPQELNMPIDKRSLNVSRCVAVPGDTISLKNGLYYVNGQEHVHVGTQQNTYRVAKRDYPRCVKLMIENELHASLNNNTEKTGSDANSVEITLSNIEYYILQENLKDVNFELLSKYSEEMTMTFILPAKGSQLVITPNNLKIYQTIIESEQGVKNIDIRNDELYVMDEKQDSYTFLDNYYWVLSDNKVAPFDSNTLGFIPFRNVIGKAERILYNNRVGGRTLKNIN